MTTVSKTPMTMKERAACNTTLCFVCMLEKPRDHVGHPPGIPSHVCNECLDVYDHEKQQAQKMYDEIKSGVMKKPTKPTVVIEKPKSVSQFAYEAMEDKWEREYDIKIRTEWELFRKRFGKS